MQRRDYEPELPCQPRRLPVGAEMLNADEAHFRVWAPAANTVEVELKPHVVRLANEGNGYFAGRAKAQPGMSYRFRLNSAMSFPDPASRFQPEGPHGPSQIVDPGSFRWTDANWRGINVERVVLYEMHIGTFTLEGTWAAAESQLEELANLGITMIEVMPVADFPGRFGWGYDGVNLFAPTRLYGVPDDFRRFVDRAHRLGVGVILDVVYNHFGPDGNYLDKFSNDYFTDRHKNEWGEAINFDGPNSQPVREFFLANAGYWIDEFHLDGLRLDATQQIFDASEESIVRLIGRKVREAARGRSTLVVGENEPQHANLVRPETQGGDGLDALWNDDFHHSAVVAMTGKKAAYYSDYNGAPQELISALKWGFLFQGQRYAWQKKPRGAACLDLAPTNFVAFLQNHDQIANSGKGLPINALTSPGRLRTMTTLLLLGPNAPMLFQGQEFGSSKPFYYFADHHQELARLVAEGRRKFLSQFPELALPATQSQILDPADEATFAGCRLDFNERIQHAGLYALHRDLLKLRREDPVFAHPIRRGLDGAVLSSLAFALRYFGENGRDRLIVVNLGRDLRCPSIPEPLVAPPSGTRWNLLLTSDDLAYGGCGVPTPDTDTGWSLPGEAAIVLAAT